MGKIMSKLKHKSNLFPQLQTKFVHKQYIIWLFPPSFNEFHHNFNILKISCTILEHLRMRKKVTTGGISH